MTNYQRENSILTVREVTQLLHIHRNTVQRWADRGVIRAYRITSRGDRRFRREDVIQLEAELKTCDGDEKKAASILSQAAAK